MSYTEFIKPYADGYENGEEGNTPVTAEILNNNYDGFLLALNEFLPELEGKVEANPSESATAGNLTKLKVGNSIYLVPSGGGSGSSVSFEQILSSGTKIGIITIDGNSVDVYAPTPSGGASAYSDLTDVIVSNPSAGQVPIYNEVSSKWENGTLPVGDDVSFTQVVSTGTKLGTITINNVDYDIYAPTQTNPALSDLTDTAISSPTDGQVIKYNSLTEKWENSDESGGGTGGHTIIDENGNSMTARAGLQFVGGANVSDDSTNDKTIVDLASAGGIDGVFIDINNVIKATTEYTGDISYTAMEDCVVAYEVVSTSSASGWVKIDNVPLKRVLLSNGNIMNTDFIFVKKGQTVSLTTQTVGTWSVAYTVYGIQTGTTHSKFQPVIYSTEEREIGVWTDGRPLYQKSYYVSAQIDDNSVVIDSALDYSVVKIRTTKFGSLKIGGNYNNAQYADGRITPSSGMRVGLNNTGLWYACANPPVPTSQNPISDFDFTIQYTKSSDTPGSGSWTPQGVPTHHYSTDEHIIGTWIDGSTIYEKTIPIQKSSISSGNNTINHLINNFGQLVKKEIIYNYSNGDMNTDLANPSNNDYRMEVGDIGSTDFTLFIGTSAFSLVSVIYATLQYTKTS